MGNHEDRIPKLQASPNEIIKTAANAVMADLTDLICKRLKAKLTPYDIDAGWLRFGDTDFGHGYPYGENALRDTAILRGKCVIAHLHTPGQVCVKRSDGATGYCVGWLGDKARMKYAKTQASRSRWCNAFAWGEYCHNETIVRLEKRCVNGEWRLPL